MIEERDERTTLVVVGPSDLIVRVGRPNIRHARAEEEPKRSAIVEARERGELHWGNDCQGGAPYVFQDPMDPNHLIGFEVDFAKALA